MRSEEAKMLVGILKEHFAAYTLVGFDLGGERFVHTEYETELQSHAITNALREYVREAGPAAEVWVRNLEE